MKLSTYICVTQNENDMSTKIKEHDRKGYEGLKFAFICDDKFLCVEESAQAAIDWFIDFTGREPSKVIQESKFPFRG